jgi:hypothetical protein
MIWKDIPGYEGLYQVSDCGQIKSYTRVRWNGKVNYIQKEKILKPGLTNGYHNIGLYKGGKRENFYIHRLVALAFLDGDSTLTVNHIDECKTNNHVSNLEYLTRGDNTRAWIKNNPDRMSDRVEKSIRVKGQQVLDTETGIIFPSVFSASRYMHEKEGAKGLFVWDHKIRLGKQNRFQILNN